MPERIKFIVDAHDAELRLDQVLARHIESLSRRKARVLLDIGGVYVDGRRVKVAGRKLRSGQTVEAVLGQALENATGSVGKAARARDAGKRPPPVVVFEDEDLVVVDKPAGLLATPTPEGDRGNAVDFLSRRPESPSVIIVHRIDSPTSGLLVYAKSETASRSLSQQFRDHQCTRKYLAIVCGQWPVDLIQINESIDGKHAVSHFEVVANLDTSEESATVLSVQLETGRTHQIRRHCHSAGHGVVGDRTYRSRREALDVSPPKLKRLALHAANLGFVHPNSGESMNFVSALPAELEAIVSRASPKSV